jgi:hypothetical protein
MKKLRSILFYYNILMIRACEETRSRQIRNETNTLIFLVIRLSIVGLKAEENNQ